MNPRGGGEHSLLFYDTVHGNSLARECQLYLTPVGAREVVTRTCAWNRLCRDFVGRDGGKRAVHSGFPSRGSGEELTRVKDEIRSTIERMLAEPVSR